MACAFLTGPERPRHTIYVIPQIGDIADHFCKPGVYTGMSSLYDDRLSSYSDNDSRTRSVM